ncbi:MAG: AAA family ATPase [Prevotella sp.]|nr:AAA family ATPase [Prevotella sp.]
MNHFQSFDPEAATNLFDELQAIATPAADEYREAYSSLRRVFMKCLDQHTRFAGIRFGGPFAKTDYLLKEHKAPRHLRVVVNDARARFRKLGTMTDEALADNFRYDFMAVCQFVELVSRMPVPTLLEALFPGGRKRERGKLTTECLRIIVNRWDDTFIYAEADEEGMDEVKVFYGEASDRNVYKDWKWDYLRPLLKEGCQLNLVRPREMEGVLYPELMVYEPDFLVDISAIAACFESYSRSHMVYLVNKLKPSVKTSAMLLGNLAGQFLDEALYLRPEDSTYHQSVRRFFEDNAMSLLTTPLDSHFHQNAQMQRTNIQNVVRSVMPEVFRKDGIQRFDATEIMVEPSFYSEMLGIQGRMDFLQLDQRFLIEQKSGKAAFPETDPPTQQEKHYAQLILYMMLLRYNYREQYERNGRNVHSMLLYSKYRNGLVELGFAPSLMFEAMKIRNEIVAHEYGYSHGGFTILERLTADDLKTEPLRESFWLQYKKPEVDAVLLPIQAASPLERAYYLRFLTFIETEHLMAKVGNQTKQNAGFADKWHCSLEEKLLAGNIYCDLDMVYPSEVEGGRVDHVELRFAERPDNDISNFRKGDIVVLYPYAEGTEPDARTTMVFRGTIEKIGDERIVMSLKSQQVNANVFWHQGAMKWAMEHDFMEASYSSLYKGMHAFLSAPKERRDLLLLQREPECDGDITLGGDYGEFNDMMLRAKRARDLFLIIGPPGTGKTSYGLMNTLKEELLEPNANVLLLSYTNRAVDEICGKLEEEHIDYIRVGSRLSCEPAYRHAMFDERVKDCGRVDELRRLVNDTRVFVGTTTSFNSNSALFGIKQFSLAIIDEASQILEPHLMGLLSARGADGQCAIRKIILIGDHKQLPAVVQQGEEESRVDEPILNDICLTNCRLSLFERLLRRYKGRYDVVGMLTKQGRMHPDIARFPNYAFYGNKLQVVPCPHQRRELPAKGGGGHGIDDMLATRRVAFVAVNPQKNSPSDKVNRNEAQVIATIVLRIYGRERDHFSPMQTVGVIVPYRNQIAEVRKTLEKSGIAPLRDITIDTVERYQGSQRDYIVYGFTIQQYYQLDFLAGNVFEEDGCVVDRKLNVAMTRAREHLILVGNPGLLANNFTFYKLMEYVRSRHGYFDVPMADIVRGRFVVEEMDSKAADGSQASFHLSDLFQRAFRQLVVEPLQKDSRTQWPDIILGRDMAANMEAIGYGRMDFSQPVQAYGALMSAEEQVLVYCHYFMRMYYCGAMNVYSALREWVKTAIRACGGRVQFLDFGCGPATSGLAFAEQFLAEAPDMLYTGIDISAEMRMMAEKFLHAVFGDRLRYRLLSSMGEMTDDYWKTVSEIPTLVVFNFAHVFSDITARQAEHLALTILDVIKRHPLNKYLVFVQHSLVDSQVNAYKVFKTILEPAVDIVKTGQTTKTAEIVRFSAFSAK